MKTIWKYKIEMLLSIEMPIGAKIVYVGEQDNMICLWAIVDTEKKNESRFFRAYCTGEKIENPHREPGNEDNYVGTVLLDGGNFVLHVYEMII